MPALGQELVGALEVLGVAVDHVLEDEDVPPGGIVTSSSSKSLTMALLSGGPRIETERFIDDVAGVAITGLRVACDEVEAEGDGVMTVSWPAGSGDDLVAYAVGIEWQVGLVGRRDQDADHVVAGVGGVARR